MATALRPFLSRRDLLEAHDVRPNPDHYHQEILYVEPDGSFSVVAIVWLPGQRTEIHNHVAWCSVGVYQGVEFETKYAVDARDAGVLHQGESVTRRVGEVEALIPGSDIHQVTNPGPETAISLHVYGANIAKLGSSINRCYDPHRIL